MAPRYRPSAVPERLSTTTQDLGESRVRVDVEVAPDTLQRELDTAASALGRELKIPGFRKGKVPAAIVIRSVGRVEVLVKAMRRARRDWYKQTVSDAGIATV